jgi:hypothetical protein
MTLTIRIKKNQLARDKPKGELKNTEEEKKE